MVSPLITKQNTKMRRAIQAIELLSLTLRFLATGETFRSLSFQYPVGSTTVSKIVMETCVALHQAMKEKYLTTPKTEWQQIARHFEERWQFPHCIGALDGKHIQIQPPAKSGSLFHNYKGRSSVVMMAVVDANYKFIYADVGAQGRVSDAGLFAHSDLCKVVDEGLLQLPPLMPCMNVGDEAYPLRTDLMKPFPYRDLDHDQNLFFQNCEI